MSVLRVIISVFFIYISLGIHQLFAQDSTLTEHSVFSALSANVSGEGTIDLTQSPSLTLLIEKHTRINESKGLEGYRIQIFSASGQSAREQATAAGEKFLQSFPDFDANLVYVEYPAPFFKVRVGDYRTKNDAFEFFQQVKKYFPDSYIVKSTINFPKLISDETPGGQK